MKNWGRWAVIVGAVPLLLAVGGVARSNAQGVEQESLAQDAAKGIASVREAALGAIREGSADGSVADFEAAILFAIDNIQQASDVVDKGLAEAFEATSVANAREAIANIRAMKLRAAGTSAIPTGLGGTVSFGGGGAGGGGGGTGNYSS
ncbi:MAG: hypothetical protein AB7D33_04370 [Sphingobium sp.]